MASCDVTSDICPALNKGDVVIEAAATLMRGQMGLRLFLSNQNTVGWCRLTLSDPR
jgi:hypothetical protein